MKRRRQVLAIAAVMLHQQRERERITQESVERAARAAKDTPAQPRKPVARPAQGSA